MNRYKIREAGICLQCVGLAGLIVFVTIALILLCFPFNPHFLLLMNLWAYSGIFALITFGAGRLMEVYTHLA